MNFEHSLAPANVSAPVFQDSSHSYMADACYPLIQAVGASELKFAALARGHYPGHRLDPDMLPGVATIGHWDASKEQQWGLPWHRNEGIEIGFLESGAVKFAVDGRGFALQAGDLTVTQPWQLHRIGEPNMGPNRLHWLILDVGIRHPKQPWMWPGWLLLSPRELEQLKHYLSECSQPVWRATGEIRHCFREIAHAVEESVDSGNASRLAIKINDLLLSMLDLFRSQPSRRNESPAGSRQAVDLLLYRLANEPRSLALPWSLDSMAAECGLKVTQFVRHVKESTNMPPLHYLNHCRLESARRLLRDERQMSITEVALTCGFSSSQYFATLFRRRFGTTPTQFSAGL